MVHNIRIVKKEQQTVNKWAGGTTTQLAIYPETASYGDRDFAWRLSSATVELEKSDFTKLPGFDRILMVLEGDLRLEHRGHHEVLLQQYQQDNFRGSWDTVSYGQARDFNLMTKEGLSGSLKHHALSKQEKLDFMLGDGKDAKGHYAFYVHKGIVEIMVEDQVTILDEGDLLVFEGQKLPHVKMSAVNGIRTDVIEAWIEI